MAESDLTTDDGTLDPESEPTEPAEDALARGPLLDETNPKKVAAAIVAPVEPWLTIASASPSAAALAEELPAPAPTPAARTRRRPDRSRLWTIAAMSGSGRAASG